MRTIEQKLLKYFKNGWTGYLSERDAIVSDGDLIEAKLWNTTYCKYERSTKTLTIGVPNARWQTATTKSRINSFANLFGVPGLYQDNFVFFWADGELYQDVKVYQNVDIHTLEIPRY